MRNKDFSLFARGDLPQGIKALGEQFAGAGKRLRAEQFVAWEEGDILLGKEVQKELIKPLGGI